MRATLMTTARRMSATVLAIALALAVAGCTPSPEPPVDPESTAPSATASSSAAPTPSPSTPDAAAALEGTWTAAWSDEELLESTETETDEITDENWGTFTLTLKDGRGTEKMQNDFEKSTAKITYTVEGDVLNVVRDSGEEFTMTYTLEGDTLQLERDDPSDAPITYVILPLERA